MNTIVKKAPEGEDVEHLLPWHAAGTLSRRDAQRVEQALARDPGLARRYALVREELSETILLNETLGAPSARVMERLFARIEAERGPARKPRTTFSFSTWLSEKMSVFSARSLAYAATAGALAIVLQAGLLASFFFSERDTVEYRGIDIRQTTSQPATVASGTGSFAFVGFVSQATVADITNFLTANNLAVVDGPRIGGLYRVRLSPTILSKDDADRIAGRLRENRTIVSFIVPTE